MWAVQGQCGAEILGNSCSLSGWTVIDFSILEPPDGIKTHLCLFRLRLIFVVVSANAMNRCCTLALAFVHTLYLKM